VDLKSQQTEFHTTTVPVTTTGNTASASHGPPSPTRSRADTTTNPRQGVGRRSVATPATTRFNGQQQNSLDEPATVAAGHEANLKLPMPLSDGLLSDLFVGPLQLQSASGQRTLSSSPKSHSHSTPQPETTHLATQQLRPDAVRILNRRNIVPDHRGACWSADLSAIATASRTELLPVPVISGSQPPARNWARVTATASDSDSGVSTSPSTSLFHTRDGGAIRATISGRSAWEFNELHAAQKSELGVSLYPVPELNGPRTSTPLHSALTAARSPSRPRLPHSPSTLQHLRR
jgi:hypothetical protein